MKNGFERLTLRGPRSLDNWSDTLRSKAESNPLVSGSICSRLTLRNVILEGSADKDWNLVWQQEQGLLPPMNILKQTSWNWEPMPGSKQSLALQTVHSLTDRRVIFLCAQCGKDSWSQDSLFSHSHTHRKKVIVWPPFSKINDRWLLIWIAHTWLLYLHKGPCRV